MPVVGSDSGEIPYVVADAGVIVRERDVDGWTEAIARLLADPGLRARMGRAGRLRAEASFDYDVLAPRLAGSLGDEGG